MEYTELQPADILKPYVKCYFIIEKKQHGEFSDTLYPGGNIEFVFNLGEGSWQSRAAGEAQTDPLVELLSQITRPITISCNRTSYMLGIRFYPHTASKFLNEDLSTLNNQIFDLSLIAGSGISTLHSRLQATPLLSPRIALIEAFLIGRLSQKRKRHDKTELIGRVIRDMERGFYNDNIEAIAGSYNITPRYLQKIFLQQTGITPKVYSRINRFQLSLKHLAKPGNSLTSVAYKCGYADQSHFIRDFKSFTGNTPSAHAPNSFLLP
jgi:AraC-like DNA-binding protein